MGTKTNKIIDIDKDGFLILDDFWITENHKSIFCVNTNSFHEITDFKYIDINSVRIKKSCIKVVNQESIKKGYIIVPKYTTDTTTLS